MLGTEHRLLFEVSLVEKGKINVRIELVSLCSRSNEVHEACKVVSAPCFAFIVVVVASR